jgi:RNA polymerase sigma-70 factor, ECF subfamily
MMPLSTPTQSQNEIARFERLRQQHQDAVYRQMVRVCGNREDALDVLQEALLRAYRALDTLQADAAFRVWLGRIARNVCTRMRSREALLPLLSLDSSADGEVWADTLATSQALPETAAIHSELKALLHRAIDSLPASLREVYTLRDVEELSAAETAARLNLTQTAVKARLHRARAYLRERLNALFLGTEKI